jgi:hypothetical protein
MLSRKHSQDGHNKQIKCVTENETGPCYMKGLWRRLHQITPEQVDKYRSLRFLLFKQFIFSAIFFPTAYFIFNFGSVSN